ncbi:MAG: secretin N-terminal domain-containing protein [Alphaproteobacteria bacterium]|nr:secretin N-terminal domain-containing protein [Alphaproteobacteria bacterium]
MRSPKQAVAVPFGDNAPPIPEMKVDPPHISLQASGATGPPIPDLAEIIAAPQPPKIGQTKVISVSVTDDVPLKDILIELSRLADVDVEIDSSITGGITFRAKDRPFNEVIDRICSMAGLRYSMRNNVLRIERDVPYVQTYPLDMLNIDRNITGSISVTSSGAGSDSGGSSSDSSATGSSSTSITAASKSDFWSKFQESVTQILAFKPTALGAGVGNNPAATEAFFSLNQQAGTLTFSGTERQHAVLRSFLRAIEANISSQVLIEAKIVEVSLNDSYQAGIDWSKLGGNSVAFNTDLAAVTAANAALSPASITVLKNDILRTGVDLSVAVNLLDEFGTTRALSSPRLNAMNNQQAVLSFTENLVYFDVNIEVTDAVAGTGGSAGTPAKVEVTSEPKTAPVGIVLALQPSINKDSNEITLNVRPTLSKVTKFITDPGFEIGKANAAAQLPSGSPVLSTLNSVQSTIPQLEVRELDSILKVSSGQVMVIGGLLEDKFTSDTAGIPGAKDLPYFGRLFSSDNKVTTKKELVIFIRATIVPSSGSAQPADRLIYNKFIDDPRPLDF